MKKKRGIIFDLDGTLVDSLPGIKSSILYAIRKQGHAIDDNIELRSLIGPPIECLIQKLLTSFDDDRVSAAVEIYREHYGSIGLYKSSTYHLIEETIIALKDKGFDLYIATLKRQTFAEKVLKTVNLQDFFSVIQGSSADGTPLAPPNLQLRTGELDNKSDLLRNLILSATLGDHELVLVGDRRNDVAAAHANQIPAIGALWGYGSKDELNEALVDVVCDDPSFLPETIEQIFSRQRPSPL